jgi:hypothetical protein
MNKIKEAAFLGAFILSFGVAPNSSGAFVAQWSNFDGAGNLAAGLSADQGNGTLNASAGDTINLSTGNPASSLSAVTGAFVLMVSGTGLSEFTVNYDGLAGGGPVNQLWEWSTDGINFSSSDIAAQPAMLTDTANWTARSIDFSGVTALSGATDIYFRNTVDAAGGFDNLSIQAVPESVNVALIVFSFFFTGIGVCRWFSKRGNIIPCLPDSFSEIKKTSLI